MFPHSWFRCVRPVAPVLLAPLLAAGLAACSTPVTGTSAGSSSRPPVGGSAPAHQGSSAADPSGTPGGAATSGTTAPPGDPAPATPSATSDPPQPSTASPTTPAPRPLPTLPRGGRTILPGHRVVAYYGNGQSPGLGVLGQYPPRVAAAKVAEVARQYAVPGRPVLPAMELIVTVADGYPGPRGVYSHPTDPAVIERYLKAARAARELLVLDIQPGRATFLPEVRRYERFLVQPDVELALDPEWRMTGGGVPGRVIGHVDATEVNAVSAYLSGLVSAHRLPQKLLLLHEFTPYMIRDKQAVRQRPHVALVWHIDGFGSRGAKLGDYRTLHEPHPSYMGFKLFYRQDLDMMTPADVLRMSPPPDFISYQ